MRKILPTLLASALFGACALTAAGMAFAADPAATGTTATTPGAKRAQFRQQFFDKIDTNGDGVISRAEYQAWVDSRFDKLDSNRDGSVDANEIASSPATAARVEKRAEGFVKRFDQSGDGKVSKSDFEAKEMARFDKLSGGADTLTEDQLRAQHGAFRHRGAAQQGQAGGASSENGG
ncbi:MAG TPA: EF-hand domain-containing protein [Dokdonella sp.]